ncbi:MAG: hypothetical protein L0323_06475 [Planctomycetes bacterium]|nr:hypothetical protein [Planctomycetota bacterium]
MSELLATSRLLPEIAGVDVQPNQAGVGRNAFARFKEPADRTRRVTDDDRAAIAEAVLPKSVGGGTTEGERS